MPRGTSSHAIGERRRAIDLAERPRREGKKRHRSDARVHSEAISQVVVAARAEQGERAFQMTPRFDIVSGK